MVFGFYPNNLVLRCRMGRKVETYTFLVDREKYLSLTFAPTESAYHWNSLPRIVCSTAQRIHIPLWHWLHCLQTISITQQSIKKIVPAVCSTACYCYVLLVVVLIVVFYMPESSLCEVAWSYCSGKPATVYGRAVLITSLSFFDNRQVCADSLPV